LSRGFDPAGYPAKPLVSYQVLPTTFWVDPSTGDRAVRDTEKRGSRQRNQIAAILTEHIATKQHLCDLL
jgi:hypothetical protein